MKTLKNILAFILNFTTGLGFYGIGLLGLAFVFYFFFAGQFYTNIGTGLVGAFIYKNYAAIIKVIKGL